MIDKYKFYYRTFVVVFWIQMCYGFFCEELFPPLIPLRNILFLFLDIIFFILGICVIRTKKDVTVFLSFIFIGILSTIVVNRLSIICFFNGTREFLGLLFAAPIFNYFLNRHDSEEFKKRFDKQLKIFLYIQAFCLVWQFIRYGANDHGGGSLGNLQSGAISMLIYFVSFYLSLQNWDFNDYWASIKNNKWNIILLFPTFLNETKISFILLFLYFVLLYKPNKSTILKLFYIIPVTIGLFFVFGNLYLEATGQDSDKFTIDYFYDYLYGEDLGDLVEIGLNVQDGLYDMTDTGTWTQDIPRFGKLALMFGAVDSTRGGSLFGAGLGQFKGGKMVDTTRFAKEYEWLLLGSRPWLFFVFIQLGFIGIVWFFAMIIAQLLKGKKMIFPGKKIIIYVSIALFFVLFYNDSLRFLDVCLVTYYIVYSIRRIYNVSDVDDLSSQKVLSDGYE